MVGEYAPWKEFWKLDNSGHELFIFEILFIAIDWNL